MSKSPWHHCLQRLIDGDTSWSPIANSHLIIFLWIDWREHRTKLRDDNCELFSQVSPDAILMIDCNIYSFAEQKINTHKSSKEIPDLPSNHNISLLQPSDIDKFVQFVPERDQPSTVIGHFHKRPSTFFTQQKKICNKTSEVYETHILPRWFHSFKNSDQLKKEANRFFVSINSSSSNLIISHRE